ncbi:hypothetical protein QE416_003069 [Microbacterium sp. SORGH_AS 421]|nr:hypothetical protein [Microbacterium sp. SORGH_AS_0421]
MLVGSDADAETLPSRHSEARRHVGHPAGRSRGRPRDYRARAVRRWGRCGCPCQMSSLRRRMRVVAPECAFPEMPRVAKRSVGVGVTARVGHVTTPEPARVDDLASFAAANGWTYQPTAEPPALSGDMWEYATAGNVQDRIAGPGWEAGRIVGGARKAENVRQSGIVTIRTSVSVNVPVKSINLGYLAIRLRPATAALRSRCAEQRRHPVVSPAPTTAQPATLARGRLRHALPSLRTEGVRARRPVRLHARPHGSADR